jgi:hypothetical protein
VLLSLFFSTSGGSTRAKLVLLVAFTANPGAVRRVVLLVTFTVLAERFGLESILGAFLAGAVVGLLDRDSSSHPHFRTKLSGLLAHPSALAGPGTAVPARRAGRARRTGTAGLWASRRSPPHSRCYRRPR